MGRKNPEPAKENSDTGTGEADDGGGRGLGAHDDELKRRTGTGSGGEEVEQGPLERVEAVLAIVDPHHHHRLPHHRRRSLRLRGHILHSPRSDRNLQSSGMGSIERES